MFSLKSLCVGIYCLMSSEQYWEELIRDEKEVDKKEERREKVVNRKLIRWIRHNQRGYGELEEEGCTRHLYKSSKK